MNRASSLGLSSAFLLLSTVVYAQPTCVAPSLSDQDVKDIIDKGRAQRTDLPQPFPKYRWLVRRQGCHYEYIEYGLPEAPEFNHIFKLNQHGVIVNVQTGGETVKAMKCPGKTLTDADLAQIIRDERRKRCDLPPAFASHKPRVARSGCLYLYFEYALPETRGDYQVFTIDPLGELVDFSRSQSNP